MFERIYKIIVAHPTQTLFTLVILIIAVLCLVQIAYFIHSSRQYIKPKKNTLSHRFLRTDGYYIKESLSTATYIYKFYPNGIVIGTSASDIELSWSSKEYLLKSQNKRLGKFLDDLGEWFYLHKISNNRYKPGRDPETNYKINYEVSGDTVTFTKQLKLVTTNQQNTYNHKITGKIREDHIVFTY
jgi:hypothetical protein